MSDLGWRADGIARARAAGGVDLERYRRPGFTGGDAVRVCAGENGVAGFQYDGEVDPSEDDWLSISRVPGARVWNDHVRRTL